MISIIIMHNRTLEDVMKDKYEDLMMEVIRFEAEDIIITSESDEVETLS